MISTNFVFKTFNLKNNSLLYSCHSSSIDMKFALQSNLPKSHTITETSSVFLIVKPATQMLKDNKFNIIKT
jgi:hypothetical protein